MLACDAENKGLMKQGEKAKQKCVVRKKEVKLEKVMLKQRGGNSQFPGLCLVHLLGLVFTRFSACHMATGCSRPMGLQKGTSSFLISPNTALQNFSKNFSSKESPRAPLEASVWILRIFNTQRQTVTREAITLETEDKKTRWMIGCYVV